jgi:hypothetical protein
MPPTNSYESKNQMEENETASVCEKCGGSGVITRESPGDDGDMDQWEQVCECRLNNEPADMSGAGDDDR